MGSKAYSRYLSVSAKGRSGSAQIRTGSMPAARISSSGTSQPSSPMTFFPAARHLAASRSR